MTKSKSKSKKECELIYVIAGKEETLVNAQSQELLNDLIEPSQRATGFFDADPGQVSVSEVLDELRTVPFLTDKRVVLIKGADKFISNNRELLEKYFDSPCSTGTLVLVVSTWDTRTKLAKKLEKVGKVISVTQPKPWLLPRRLTKYASEAHDKKLTEEAAELIVELAGDDLPRLYSEVDKLALFADVEKVIDVRHIESLIGHNRIFGAFAVIDACLAGDTALAVDRLRNMFAEDRNAQYTVVGAFAFQFRRMFGAKVLLEKGISTSEIVSRLRIWGSKDGFFAQVRKTTLKQIGSALQKLAAIDYAIKTGRTKAEVAIEQLVLNLANIQH